MKASFDSFGSSSDKRIAKIFTHAELWLMRAFVRHDMPNKNQWEIPPVSKELNNDIALALLMCSETGSQEAAIMLSENDTFVLDYLIPQDAKDASGRLIGKDILLKVFAARRDLLVHSMNNEEPEETMLSPKAIQEKMDNFNNKEG